MENWKAKLKIVGVVPTIEYQRAKFLAEMLFRYMSDKFEMPEFRPMMDVAWKDFIVKIGRRMGESTWRSSRQVAVFLNKKYLGDDEKLQNIVECSYNFRIFKDFEKLGVKDLKGFLDKNNRPHIYCIISIDHKIIGTLLFELYDDLVPETCSNFLRLCKQKPHGYTGSPVHRICKKSFIQVGGSNLIPERMACENYYVGHDSRGVLSMCNDGKHKRNSTQFFISLDPASWMDGYYVAFGQVIHGETVLEQIENERTVHESPVRPIRIEQIGEYDLTVCQTDEYFRPIYNQYKETINTLASKRLLEKQRKREEQQRIDEIEQRCSCWDSNSTSTPIYPPDIVDPNEIGSISTIRTFTRKQSKS